MTDYGKTIKRYWEVMAALQERRTSLAISFQAELEGLELLALEEDFDVAAYDAGVAALHRLVDVVGNSLRRDRKTAKQKKSNPAHQPAVHQGSTQGTGGVT